MSCLQNTKKPVGLGGKLMAKGMNSRTHAKLAVWAEAFIHCPGRKDSGCGLRRWSKCEEFA